MPLVFLPTSSRSQAKYVDVKLSFEGLLKLVKLIENYSLASELANIKTIQHFVSTTVLHPHEEVLGCECGDP